MIVRGFKMYKTVDLLALKNEDYNYRIDVNNLNKNEIEKVLSSLMYFTDEVIDSDSTGVSCWLDHLENALSEVKNIKNVLKIQGAKNETRINE